MHADGGQTADQFQVEMSAVGVGQEHIGDLFRMGDAVAHHHGAVDEQLFIEQSAGKGAEFAVYGLAPVRRAGAKETDFHKLSLLLRADLLRVL